MTAKKLAELIKGSEGEDRLSGCYLYPLALLAAPDYDDPYSMTEVRWTVPTNEHDVLVTVNGGLFVQVPAALAHRGDRSKPEYWERLSEKQNYEREASRSLNMVLCELALRGIVSEAVSPVYMSPAFLCEGHVLAASYGGGREAYTARSVDVATSLVFSRHLGVPVREIDPGFSELALARMVDALALEAATLVTMAYSGMSRGQYAESVLTSFTVVEQYIDKLYAAHRAATGCKNTDLVKPQLDRLLADNVIDKGAHAVLDAARCHRNALAHRAAISREAAQDCAHALHLILERVCGTGVEPPLLNDGVSW